MRFAGQSSDISKLDQTFTGQLPLQTARKVRKSQVFDTPVDERVRPILRQDLTRAQFESFLGKTLPTEVVLEFCGSSHHWGRVAQALGHTVRLIPAQYVKPFVKRGKNNRNDAEAIGEEDSAKPNGLLM